METMAFLNLGLKMYGHFETITGSHIPHRNILRGYGGFGRNMSVIN